ncbi:hypothetical protein NsoK4_03905 [Nitrosopumilus sp. K4]|uniref:hypothetical protein n=1 Tax=Nitrosopumilus sp. K4 TaxID=2795383 RepID=UPI001BAB9C4C|nr:hypothetical protein [Nitrosopumilus sp. K4]QUC65398.1 hypothetical protein NsoK4_03905 [Nitrosopumilus sp. K4]
MLKEILLKIVIGKNNFRYSQQFNPTTEFLQMVLYIPNPKIIAAKAASGTKMNILVFKPIKQVSSIPIKLSQFIL